MGSESKKVGLAVAAVLFLCGAVFAQAEIEVSSFPLPEGLSDSHRIRVAVMQNLDEVRLAAASPYRVETIQTGALIARGASLSWTKVQSRDKGLAFGDRAIGLYGFSLTSPHAVIKVGDKSYRDAVRVLRDGKGKLSVVNEIGLEEYLRGVLPGEMWNTWPLEVLKAQAVASRTYALFKALTKAAEDYSLMSNTISQVYGGRGTERPGTDKAVSLTKGEILAYKGEIFPAYFHATCAGETTRPEYNWDIEPHPVLKGVECPYCVSSKHYRWSGSIALDEIKKLLNRQGYSVGAILDIVPKNLDQSGRPRSFLIKHAGGELEMRGNDFRLAIGHAKVMKGLKDIAVVMRGGQAYFSGLGWGHGVGMCQWGAKAMVDQGKNYREILAFYYPRSEIKKIY